jgi:transposase
MIKHSPPAPTHRRSADGLTGYAERSGGNRVATRRHFTQEYKDQAVSLVLDSGRTIAEVAKSIGVHEMTLGKWVKKAREAGRVPDSDLSEPERAELERLRKENAVLRMERDFAKKVATWFAKEQP